MVLRRPALEAAPRYMTAAIVVVAAVVCVWLNFPGHLSYDSVVQLAEGRSGVYAGEHPPVMSWLLGLADQITPGAAAFVVLDTVLIFGALLALATMVPRVSWLAVAVAALCACLPQLAIYPAIVWKDVLFAGSATAGFAALAGAATNWRRSPLRDALLATALALLILAALARQNGAIVVPFAALALGWIAARAGEPRRRAVIYGVGFLAVSAVLFIAVSVALATRVEPQDGDNGAWTALQTYDVVAAAVRDPALRLEVLETSDPSLAQRIRAGGVAAYAPSRVDSIQALMDGMDDTDAGPVAAQWRDLIWRHPLLYLRLRAAAFRWVFLTPAPAQCVFIVTGVAGPSEEMASAGLKPRRTAADTALARYALSWSNTLVYSHAAYAAVGLALLVLLLRRRRPADIAVAAMLASALTFVASFAVISIACDYRYLYDLDLAVIAAALYAAASWRSLKQPPANASPATPEC